MAFIQRNSPPPNEKERFAIKNFSGGLNNRSRDLRIHECADILNMAFTNDETMEKRKGTKLYDNGTMTGSVTFVGSYHTYTDGNFIIRANESEVQFRNDAIQVDAFHSGTITSGITYQGKYFFCDGTNLFTFGKFPQSATTYVGISGTPVDDYRVMKVVNPPNGFTPLGPEHEQGVTRYDYNANEVWYEPCENELDDPYLNSNVLPQRASYIVEHNGRLFVSGNAEDDDNVFITDVRNPYYFAVALPIQLPPNSDAVRGLSIYDDTVVVGREHDMFVIEGLTNNPNLGFPLMRLRRLNTHAGFANHHAVDIVHNYLFYLGADGVVYALTSTRRDEKNLSTVIISKTLDLHKAPINATSYITQASSAFLDDLYYLNLVDKVLVYSYRHQAWTVYDQMKAVHITTLLGDLVWGRSDGVVATFSEDYMDIDGPYIARWKSKSFDMERPSTYKQFREFFLVAHTFKEYKSDIRMQFDIDYDTVLGDAVIENSISTWGEMKWGDRLMDKNINASKPFILGRRGRNLSIEITNGYISRGNVATEADLDVLENISVYDLYFVVSENAYYVLQPSGTWRKLDITEYNQPMLVYEINGEYEFRGKR